MPFIPSAALLQTASGVVPTARSVISGVTQYSIPGVDAVTNSTWTASAARAQYFPFVVTTSITIDQIVFELVTGVAASTSRACIYTADTSWQPGTLVTNTDTGALATEAANQGVIATTITDTILAPGRYLSWFNASTGNPILRSVQTQPGIFLGYPVALTASLSFNQIYEAQAYGAPPSSGLAWTQTSVSSSSSPFSTPIFVRIKTP